MMNMPSPVRWYMRTWNDRRTMTTKNLAALPINYERYTIIISSCMNTISKVLLNLRCTFGCSIYPFILLDILKRRLMMMYILRYSRSKPAKIQAINSFKTSLFRHDPSVNFSDIQKILLKENIYNRHASHCDVDIEYIFRKNI